MTVIFFKAIFLLSVWAACLYFSFRNESGCQFWYFLVVLEDSQDLQRAAPARQGEHAQIFFSQSQELVTRVGK